MTAMRGVTLAPELPVLQLQDRSAALDGAET
jgi:hypothetical protein